MTVKRKSLKRIFDIIVSSFLIIVLFPVFIFIMLAILIAEPRRNPFFIQKRMTKDFKKFYLCKFRTMTEGRVTKIGKFIRRRGFDELPQLFNVLFGQMSFVGPRAHTVDEAYFLILISPEYAKRFQVKAGITGACQIRGINVSKRNVARMRLLSEIDKEYISNQSTRGDFAICVQTLGVVLSGQKYQKA